MVEPTGRPAEPYVEATFESLYADGPALGSAEDPGYILCNDGTAPAAIAIPVANLGEPP